MTQAIYEEVIRLVDQLSPAEQKALVEHLQEDRKPALNPEEWLAALARVQVNILPGPMFSDRREDWYDDDGR